MGTMKIRCDYCGGSWEVYSRNRDDSKARFCPHCSQKIPEEFWKGSVLQVFEQFEKVNNDLYGQHVYEHIPLFQVEYTPDIIFVDRWKKAP